MQNVAALPKSRTDRKLLFAAGALGLIAAVLAVIYLSSAKSKTVINAPQVPVVVAAKDIGAGQKVTADMVVVKQVAEPDAVAGSFRTTDGVLGHTARYPL